MAQQIEKRHIRGSPNTKTQIVVPKESRQMFLEHFHNSAFACHYAKNKTVDVILQKYWWPQIYDDVSYWCSRCTICQKENYQIQLKSPLQLIQANGPWDIVAVDVCTFNVASAIKKELVVFVDVFVNLLSQF